VPTSNPTGGPKRLEADPAGLPGGGEDTEVGADSGSGAENLADSVGEDVVGPEIEGDLPAESVNTPSRAASNREARRREAEEDRELIILAQKGDRTAFRKLVERHQRRAFSIAVGLVRDENDARELVQEAFLRVYKGLHSFQGSSTFFTWLYRIITNLAIDLMRKPGRREVELTEAQSVDDEADLPLVARIDGADPIDVVRRREIATRIQAALDELPPYHRGVILMREIEGMSYEEMAQAMGVSKGTIMSRLFHARQKLQRALADCYAEEERRSAAGSAEEPNGDRSSASSPPERAS
jgi:RNA polymerase sigma-70 factor, ECF subfamily